MTDEMLLKLKALLIKNEGIRERVYLDSVGVPTIGVGRNLRDRGVLPDEIELMLKNDVYYFYNELWKALPVFKALDDNRQVALINMAFNLGMRGLLSFKKMLAYLHLHQYDKAADEMIDSKWATQVKGRSVQLANIIRTGEI